MPNDAGWYVLRTKAADSPGNFSADADWAGTNAFPTSGALAWPPLRPDGDEDVANLALFCIALTSGAATNRATMSFDLTLVENVMIRPETDTTNTNMVVDSATLTGVVPNRKVLVPLRGSNLVTVRFSNFANVVAGTTDIRVYARVE